MTIPLVILNLVLSIAVVSGILGLLVWSIHTQGRDHYVGSEVRIRRQPRPIESPRFGELGASQRKAAA